MPRPTRNSRIAPWLCLVVLLGGAGWVLFAPRRAVEKPSPAPASAVRPASSVTPQLASEVSALEAAEKAVEDSVFSREMTAQRCGEAVEFLWDTLNRSTNKLAVLASLRFEGLVVGRYGKEVELPHGVKLWHSLKEGIRHPVADWEPFLKAEISAGWELAQMEFRHIRFETDQAGHPLRSVFYSAGHLLNRGRDQRVLLEGDILIEWGADSADGTPPPIKTIDASGLAIKSRSGPTPFQLVLDETIAPLPKSHFIDPMICHDLDGDGVPEVILAARNLVYSCQGGTNFLSRPLCAQPPGLIFTGIIADFDGDAVVDFLCAKFEGLVLFRGANGGRFDAPGELVWSANSRIKYAQFLTCGDIDGDGDLEVWMGQYRLPYSDGQMPDPFFDANDGDPGYLLLNDGRGRFTDGTEAAGLASKRWRRAYGGSFVDLDQDGDLDLVLVSDFAGADLFLNVGHGKFREVTAESMTESHAFGMGLALTDFNADGRVDLLMVGMNSPTVDRLGHMGLFRPEAISFTQMNEAMAYGNRLYYGTANGRLESPPGAGSIARSGWSWGADAFDADNDGYPDVYIANGHDTRSTVRDYESEFWLHDIHVANSSLNPVTDLYFKSKFSRTRSRGMSYGGNERNRFYLNQGGRSFLEVGHLFGAALGQDSRNVLGEDMDGDGRMDLLVTTFEVYPVVRQTLKIYRNTLATSSNWIGFRLGETPGRALIGTRVDLQGDGFASTRQIVTGDSYRSQHSTMTHFGLGSLKSLGQVDVRWPDGTVTAIKNPAINHWHRIRQP